MRVWAIVYTSHWGEDRRGHVVGRMQGAAVHLEEQTVNVMELLVPELEGELAQQVKWKIILHRLAPGF